ncbi:MAG TPA: DUF4215 domain-containing protein [Kofleriaceae bacterium]
MDSTMRTLGILCLGVLAAALTACASNNTTQCEATGVLCPSGTHCAAAQPICISDTIRCGDAHLDSDEECDDGNNIDGDGCSHLCTIEICGNKRLDPHEQCDDGNTKDGDGCSAKCTVEVCGNGIKDFGEVCDDGNTKDGDGCSHDCKSREICGNGIVDTAVGEICDDGNTADRDGCSGDCRSGEGCGNGILDPGEECDDGNRNNNDDCRNDCVINRCGDGVLNTDGGGTGHTEHVEECDDAPVATEHSRAVTPTETATCNIDCTRPTCGDGKVNHHFMTPKGPEQCDTGSANADSADCTANCQINVCGDGLQDTAGPNHPEACDDGNHLDSDGCSNACTQPSCGNGIVDQGEECDDGNNDNNDDCRTDCVINRCGDGVLDSNGTHKEQCDAATLQSGGSRIVNPTESASCNSDCTIPSCGDGKVNHHFMTPKGPEQCDNGSADADSADCTANCQVNVCGDNLQNTMGPLHTEACDDGNHIDSDGCSNACSLPTCGNGIVDKGEECDDGNHNNNDDCRNDCVVNRCGDGVVNSDGAHPEQCDGAAPQTGGSRTVIPTETAACNSDCTLASCGDGKVNHSFLTPKGPEQCDNGMANANSADCTANCQVNACGDGLRNTVGPLHTEDCDDGNHIDSDGCSNACSLPTCGNGIVDQGEECDDGNKDNTDDCRNDCVINRCGDGVVDSTGTHVEQCDGAVVAQTGGSRTVIPTETPTCNIDCTTPSCGDGKVNHSFVTPNGPEQCDNGLGNADNGDCTANCQVNVCGDGLRDTAGPLHAEACDDGNHIDSDGCSNVCTLPTCGNGIVDQGEECDDGNHNNNDDCRNDCVINRCGDGVVDSAGTHQEQCDGAAVAQTGGSRIVIPTETPTCNIDCTTPSCGDGKVNPSFVTPNGPEQCDNGTANADNADCTASCQVNLCGDGVRDTQGPAHLEDCDDGNRVTETCQYGLASCTVCDSACHSVAGQISVCGDGVLDGANEVCDDRNNNACGTCSANCQIEIQAAAATGTIFAAAAADMHDGEKLVVSDSVVHDPVTFVFTQAQSSMDPLQIAFDPTDPTDNNGKMAGKIAAAINAVHGSGGLAITAAQVGTTGVVVLTHQQKTQNGNVQITTTVTTANFAVSGMTGGKAGNCTAGVACATNDDCASNLCATITTPTISGKFCAACTADANCGTGRTCNTTTGICSP